VKTEWKFNYFEMKLKFRIVRNYKYVKISLQI